MKYQKKYNAIQYLDFMFNSMQLVIHPIHIHQFYLSFIITVVRLLCFIHFLFQLLSFPCNQLQFSLFLLDLISLINYSHFLINSILILLISSFPSPSFILLSKFSFILPFISSLFLLFLSFPYKIMLSFPSLICHSLLSIFSLQSSSSVYHSLVWILFLSILSIISPFLILIHLLDTQSDLLYIIALNSLILLYLNTLNQMLL